MIHLHFIGKTEEVEACIAILAEKMSFAVSDDGITVELLKREQNGLSVKCTQGHYSIAYGLIPDFCRALCILLDKLQNCKGDFGVEEDRKIIKCGIMPDVSRNAVLRVTAAQDLISRIARMGMNTFMLYMEDVYKIDDCPYFGYMRGAYTEEELKEIDRYAAIFGVEVVPCIQTLAHLTTTLRWPYAAEICDTEDVLLVGEEKTYAFIEKMIASVSRSLSSKRIHIGMDEAWGLGTGMYKYLHKTVNKFEMMTSHLNRVVEIAKKYNKEPMMWSDMFFRIASPSGGYYDTDTVIPDEILQYIPDGVTMVYWDYYNEKAQIYRDMLNIHKTMNSKVAFFGGVWTWNGIGMNYDKTFRTTAPALKACYEGDIDEICATLWRDDGGETDVFAALLGMQLYSEYAYHKEVSKEQLYHMFKICTGHNAEDFLLFDLDNLPEAEEFKKQLKDVQGIVTASKHVLYQDLLQGLFDKQYERVDLKGHYKKIYDALSARETTEDLKLLFDYYTQLAKVLYMKADMGRKLYDHYQKHEVAELQDDTNDILDLYEEICVLHDALSALWLHHNKPFGLDRLDLRFGGLKERVDRAGHRVFAYVDGTIDAIEELEEERLPFAKAEFPAQRRYPFFISASIG